MTNTKFHIAVTIEIEKNMVGKGYTEGFNCVCNVLYLKMVRRHTGINCYSYIY